VVRSSGSPAAGTLIGGEDSAGPIRLVPGPAILAITRLGPAQNRRVDIHDGGVNRSHARGTRG
jgi:hypothetical protein